ncbi:hypothetical protein C8R45DRAFT_172943 [Mycena sanguinolenta]|nr:hypothetical protein C8R45DRAFT_172943 [Mycena sanguinolenta]
MDRRVIVSTSSLPLDSLRRLNASQRGAGRGSSGDVRGRWSNTAGGWRMEISLSTAPTERAPPGAHRDSALLDTVVDELIVSRGGTQYSSLDGIPSILCRALRPRSRVSCRDGRAFIFAGGSPRRPSPPASIRHPSAAPDIYGTLLLLLRTPPSTLSCPSPIDYSNTWFRGSPRAFAWSGCVYDRAILVYPLESSTTTLSTPNPALARIYWSSRGR